MMEYLILALLLIILWGVLERLLHKKHREKIPLLIHVNGTRGKSTTTRLITGGLTLCGYSVLGKTTGTSPRLIKENREEEIPRRGPPRIKEQLLIIREAVRERAQALVLECMAISPEIQDIAERIVEADITIITNCYPDHQEVIGGREGVIEALSHTIPTKGALITLKEIAPLFALKAREKGTTIYSVSPEEVSDEEVDSFSYPNFKENIALAKKVGEILHLPEDTFFKGMLGASPDPGVGGPFRICRGGRTLYLINAFAANDSISTKRVWEDFRERDLFSSLPVIGIFNCRRDRPVRTEELTLLLRESLLPKMRYIYLLGDRIGPFSRLKKEEKVHYLGPMVAGEEILDMILKRENLLREEKENGPLILFGFGNTRGGGESLLTFFKREGKEIQW